MKKMSGQGKTTNKTTNKQMPCTNPVNVKGYTTKRGKVVKPHTRLCPAKKGKAPSKQQKTQMRRMRGYKQANKTALANYDAMVAKFKKKKKKK